MAQVDDICAEQPEQHERLAPLARVPPEDANVFDQQRADVHRQAGQNVDGAFDNAAVVIKVALSFLPEAEPGPLPEHAATALHGRSGIVERAARSEEHTSELQSP